MGRTRGLDLLDTGPDLSTVADLTGHAQLEWYLPLPLPKPPTLVWNDAQQALIGGWQPAGYSADDVRIALRQLPPGR